MCQKFMEECSQETTSVKKRGKEELTRGRGEVDRPAHVQQSLRQFCVRVMELRCLPELSQIEVGRWFVPLCRYLDMGFPWERGTVLGKETSFW